MCGRHDEKAAHFVGIGAEEKQVEGYSGHEVDDEPPSQVVHGDLHRIRFDFVRRIYVCRTEIYKDVYYERHVHWN